MFVSRSLALATLLLPLALGPLAAQDYDRPPAGYQDGGYGDGANGGGGYQPGAAGADSSDPGALSVRMGKLEGRIREMTGQIEELQNANRKLTEQLQKFQADVDFRFNEKGGRAPGRRSDAAPLPGEGGPAMDAVGAAPKVAATRPMRNDAFDPSAQPGAPGAPKPLGSPGSAAPDPGDAPIDLTGGEHAGANTGTLAPTLQLPSATTPKSTGGTVTPGGTIIASTGNAAANTPKEEFDVALGYYKDKQYDTAEHSFTAFIQKNPKSRLVADATYFLGETFTQRGRPREAAEQYLKISTDFANSSRAPEAMLRLGTSLKALGAKEQACATFTEVTRKYPNAPAYVKTGAEREAKRAQC